jgi:hypothetical protein
MGPCEWGNVLTLPHGCTKAGPGDVRARPFPAAAVLSEVSDEHEFALEGREEFAPPAGDHHVLL